MTKTDLKQITQILPFDDKYILVAKGKGAKTKWNLMDKDGRLLSDNWFSSISKNTDGSIKTEVKATARAKKVTEVTFLNTASFAKACDVMSLVPVACLSLVDSGTIEPYTGSDKRYVAKAKLYGREVFLDKDGNIYDSNGVKLRLLFKTVDCERLYNAMDAFNRKMHYDYTPVGGTFENCKKNNISVFCFYFATDNWCVITDHKGLEMRDDTKKWTDDFIVRALPDIMPEKARNLLVSAFGTKQESTTRNDIKYWTWHLGKGDLDKVLTTLAAA